MKHGIVEWAIENSEFAEIISVLILMWSIKWRTMTTLSEGWEPRPVTFVKIIRAVSADMQEPLNHLSLGKASPESEKLNCRIREFREGIQETMIPGVKVVLRTRYQGGRRRNVPYFRAVTAIKDGNEVYAYISIAKYGWHRAWKRALLSLTCGGQRRHIVRSLNRPPRVEQYLA